MEAKKIILGAFVMLALFTAPLTAFSQTGTNPNIKKILPTGPAVNQAPKQQIAPPSSTQGSPSNKPQTIHKIPPQGPATNQAPAQQIAK